MTSMIVFFVPTSLSMVWHLLLKFTGLRKLVDASINFLDTVTGRHRANLSQEFAVPQKGRIIVLLQNVASGILPECPQFFTSDNFGII
jgi:hypothetical protein